MEWAVARARRRGADPARSPDERGGGLGLVRLWRVAGQHHAGHPLPAALLRPDRLARRQSRAVRRGDRVLRRRRLAVREQCGALDQRVRAVGDLARGGAVDRIDRVVVLADPALRRHLGGEPVLFGAGGDRGHGLCAVRRAARPYRHRRHGGLRRRGVSGQPARPGVKRYLRKPPGRCPEAWRARAQRFDFLALFFFPATFFTAFLAAFFTAFFAFLPAFLVDFFAADFFPAFLAFLALFGITFLAARLAAFLTFLTTVLTASLVASAALLIASVVCSRMGVSSFISSPRVYRSHNDSGIRQAVKETQAS